MAGDVVREREHLFLGSRLKRLAERMQGDVVRVALRAGLDIQPSQYPLLVTLDRYGPQTVSELTEAMDVSQPTVTRAVARLTEMGLVEVGRLRRDQRHKTISLTAEGRAALERSKLLVFPRVEAAVREMMQDLSGPLLEQVGGLERRLAERPLDQRALALPEAGLRVLPFSDDLAQAFYDINVEWIEAMYRVEATDLRVLENPRREILDKGGDILFVEAEGLGVVGACALQKTGERSFELTKMGVLQRARGAKAGEVLLRAVIARGLELGAAPLYLLSNRKSEAAIHLYEKLGFAHDEGIMARYGARYERCNVAMLYVGRSA
jgi:DNA-binding MarR family transcriptional regulator/N-acetylglutamate synthase-like GNAT family acetyltransferase